MKYSQQSLIAVVCCDLLLSSPYNLHNFKSLFWNDITSIPSCFWVSTLPIAALTKLVLAIPYIPQAFYYCNIQSSHIPTRYCWFCQSSSSQAYLLFAAYWPRLPLTAMIMDLDLSFAYHVVSRGLRQHLMTKSHHPSPTKEPCQWKQQELSEATSWFHRQS